MHPIRRGLANTAIALSVTCCVEPYVRFERIAFERAHVLIETIKNPCVDPYARLLFEQYGKTRIIQKGAFLENENGSMQFMGTSIDARGTFAEFRFTTNIEGPFALLLSTNVVTCGAPPPSMIIIRSEKE